MSTTKPRRYWTALSAMPAPLLEMAARLEKERIALEEHPTPAVLKALVGRLPAEQGVVLGNLLEALGKSRRRELATIVLEVTGSASELAFEPLPADDPTRRRPDISLAARVLGWRPEVDLREGLDRTYAWYRRGCGDV